jgi:ABC-2 type transport system permease protein
VRLGEVFRFEFEYTMRRATTWIYAAVLFGPAFLMVNGNAGRGFAHVNAPASLAEFSVFVGLFGTLVSAALFADAAVRDVEVGMDPLLFTSPLGKAEYLGGRFLAALAVNAVLLAAIPLDLVAPTLMHRNAGQVGPVQAVAYLQPFLIFLLPNLVLVGAILFTIATLARQVIPVYLGAIGLFIGYLIALNLGSPIQSPMLSALADPLGLSALLNMTGFWTTAERNSQLLGFSAMLVWSRVVWLVIAAAVLAMLHWKFRFVHAAEGSHRRKGRPAVVDTATAKGRPVPVARVAGTFGLRTRVWQTLAVARTSLEEIAGRRGFVAALLVAIGLVLLWGRNVGSAPFDGSTVPVTHAVADTALGLRIQPIVFLLIAVFAGELVWKDRDAGVAEIADAAPVPEGVALLGRFLALVAILAAFQSVFIAAGVLLQILQGYYDFELGLYLRILFGLHLANQVILAALAMTVHVIVNQKYLGHIVVMMAFAFTVVPDQLGIRHHLLVYGTGPGWTYSDMNGFGPFIGPFVWFKLYWAAWALLLAVVANLFWVRGREPGLRRRLRVARARFIGSTARMAGVAITLVLALGGFIFYNTNILNAYRTPDEEGLPQAEYERRYKPFEDSPQPVIVDAELRVEIYPEKPAVDMRGTYRLVNRTAASIDSVHVYTDPKVEARSMSFDRAARAVRTDGEVGYRIYALERALEPGGLMRLSFDVSYRPRGFPNSDIQRDAVSNGAYFDRRWMPIIGYQPAFELSDAEARRRFSLRPQPRLGSPDDAEARRSRPGLRDADLVHVSAVVGTAADQVAVTPGALRRSWTENGRRYFHYETDVPTGFGGTVFSGQYAVLEDWWTPSTGSGKAVDLRIYHHPTHTYVLDRMVRSMKASLEYYTGQFGPYPGSQLRIVEIPRYGTFFGRAHPLTIAVTEDNFVTRVDDREIDQPFYGTAHEVAHQWWPYQVMGALMRGHGFLSESLANYSAMMVTEKTYGPEMARRVYDHQMGRYLSGRAIQSREVPLLEVEDQPYIAYRKGAIAMYMLREQIGEECVNTALRRYLEKYRGAGPPYPTSFDLYAELRAVTPDSLQYLLTDLFETVTLWDVKTERAHVEPTGTGAYLVTIDVVGKKMRADSVGKETEVPMDDLVEIGVFAPGGDKDVGQPLYLKQHRIRSGKQTISITVPRPGYAEGSGAVSPKLREGGPARAGIDPYHKLIDRQGNDNVMDVKAAGAIYDTN